MVLSHRFGFLFVHTAKTGGSSIRARLKRLLWADPWAWLQWPAHRLDHLSGHRIAAKLPRHARAIAAEEMLPPAIYRQLFKFAFVRNPWDWQVSCWHHLKRDRPDLLPDPDDFSAYLRQKLGAGGGPQVKLDSTRRPQIEFVSDFDGTRIVDFVGRYESLQDDFDHVCDCIGIARQTLPHHRKSQRDRDYRRYYDDDSAALVAAHFARDIEAFGYRFDRD